MTGQNYGLYCEFGVGDGTSLNQLAEFRPDRFFHGFDSFEGLRDSLTNACRQKATVRPYL